jgi:WD40 repeat protein
VSSPLISLPMVLVSGSTDSSVRIWCMRDVSSRKLLDDDHELSFVTSVAISPDGRYVAATNDDGMLRMWDFRIGRLLEMVETQEICAMFVVCGVYI